MNIVSPRTIVKSRQVRVEYEGNQPYSVFSYTVHSHCETCCESCGDGCLVKRLECLLPLQMSNYGRMVVSPQDFAIRLQSDGYGARERAGQYCSVRNTLAKKKGA